MKVEAPGTGMVVELRVPLGQGGDATIKIGTVDLGVLRKSVKKLRASKKINHIYVLGRLPRGLGFIDEAIEEE